MWKPEPMPPYDDVHRSLWVAVDAPAGTPGPTVVATLRDAVESVVLPHLAPETDVETFAVRLGDDLRMVQPVRGLPWDAVLAREPLESVRIVGRLVPDVRSPAEHDRRVFKADATLTRPVVRADGTTADQHVTVGVSVVQGSLAGGEAGPDAQRAAAGWLVRTAERLDALTAFATVDFVDTFAAGQSPYEIASVVVPTAVDPARQVRGYQWLTMLGPGHVRSLGGEHALAGAPVAEVRPLPGGRYLLVLATDAREVTDTALAALRTFLAPLLPPGLPDAAAYARTPPFRL